MFSDLVYVVEFSMSSWLAKPEVLTFLWKSLRPQILEVLLVVSLF